ncbi:MAG: DNA methyltransferase [Anaerolineae bacterium]|nr:DNA methyltransferase [Anaerolineae bacterium]MCX8068039.1 DNA methyltransferase [Anaerolineae bacterium]MDW7992823.1 DNA methyltransferase [Anaerolineae bacterium]
MRVEGKVVIGDSRNMAEVADESIGLVVTSPPYWHLKDYGVPGQIGYGQTLHEYLMDLSRVWRECWRVLMPGRRLCINVGDQFARAIIYGRYKVIPLHAEVIAQCETIGFDYMGAIIWQKKTTMRTTGGAVVMGSFPYPPNGIVELDYEFILLFKKPGPPGKVPPQIKKAAQLSRDEWKEYFSGHWTFGGERQIAHEAMFPEELPRRLIRMFSFPGETVLDPFLGSGTTVRVALELERSGIGYEIQPAFLPIIREKMGLLFPVTIVQREQTYPPVDPPKGYTPRVKDARPLMDPHLMRLGAEAVYRVVAVQDDLTLRMDNGWVISLLGIRISQKRREQAMEYLRRYILGKQVFLRFDLPPQSSEAPIPAYLYLTNKIFVNRKMIEMGLADADREVWHRYRDKFLKAEARRNG